jgi:4-hydroxy-2-oxoheptanedioate aldolase
MVLPSCHRSAWPLLAAGVVIALLFGSVPSAQEAYLHLNPVIEKLVEGKHVFGVSTADLSLQNARSLAGDPSIDYVYVDMEHNPLRFDALEQFIAFLTAADKAGIAARGNLQAHPAVFARFPPYGREQTEWMVKHALDLGLMGILINNIETVEQAENIVETIRPRQLRTSAIPHPPGIRGTVVCGFWGVTRAECRRRADLWPLNPQGDLLFWPMIETQVGVENADAIAQVPGVGGFYLGAGGDLSSSYGAESAEDPEVAAAFEHLLDVCRTRDLACGGTVTPANAALRMEQGYRIFNFGGANGGLTETNAAARNAVIAAGAQR